MAEQNELPDDLDGVAPPDDPAGDIELFPPSRVASTLYRLAAASPPVLAAVAVLTSDSISVV
jgi:hypothetical protein